MRINSDPTLLTRQNEDSCHPSHAPSLPDRSAPDPDHRDQLSVVLQHLISRPLNRGLFHAILLEVASNRMHLTNQELRLMLDALIKSQFGIEKTNNPGPASLYQKITRELDKRKFD